MCENAYIYNVLAAPRLSTADEKGKGYYAGKPVRPLIVNQICVDCNYFLQVGSPYVNPLSARHDYRPF